MMLMLLSLMAAFALVLAAGAGGVVLVAPGWLRLSQRIALSWLIGSMLVSLGVWLGSFCFHGLMLQAVMTFVCLGLGSIAFVRWRHPSTIPFTRGEWIFL